MSDQVMMTLQINTVARRNDVAHAMAALLRLQGLNVYVDPAFGAWNFDSVSTVHHDTPQPWHVEIKDFLQ